jgi:hypothetical protein
MIRWTMTCTAKRELFGISPSDKPTSIIGFDLYRISSEGKIIEMWQQFPTYANGIHNNMLLVHKDLLKKIEYDIEITDDSIK